jgi:hypothetical protein
MHEGDNPTFYDEFINLYLNSILFLLHVMNFDIYLLLYIHIKFLWSSIPH